MDDDETRERTPLMSIETKPSLIKQLFAVLVTCIGGISAGLVLGYSSPTSSQLIKQHILTSAQLSWFSSLITIGAIGGGPLAGIIAQKLGRKPAIMACSVFLGAGWCLVAFANGYIMLYCGRITTGIGLGMASQSIPLYISEISTKNLRGTFVALFQLLLSVGILIVFGIGSVVSWRWLGHICNIFSLLLFLGMLLLPESPSWLVSKNKSTKAMNALQWIRGSGYDIEEEYNEIQSNILNHRYTKVTISDFFKPNLYRPLIIGLGIMVFQQGTGINAVIFNAAHIFKEAKFDPSKGQIIVAAATVMATGISCVIMDKVGRRVLLAFSGLFIIISLAVFGSFFYMTTINKIAHIEWLSITCIVVFVSAFSLGWGPIPWLIMGEVFPVRIRGVASGIAIALNWGSGFLITNQFDNLQQSSLHQYGTYWLFGGFTIIGVLFILLLLPETKGKSLEEIEASFERN